jgi:hypothetical protein
MEPINPIDLPPYVPSYVPLDLPSLPIYLSDAPVILPDINGIFEPTVEQTKAVFNNLILNEPEINDVIFTGNLGRNDTVPYIVFTLQQQTKQITNQEATIQLLMTSMSDLIKQVNILTKK